MILFSSLDIPPDRDTYATLEDSGMVIHNILIVSNIIYNIIIVVSYYNILYAELNILHTYMYIHVLVVTISV